MNATSANFDSVSFILPVYLNLPLTAHVAPVINSFSKHRMSAYHVPTVLDITEWGANKQSLCSHEAYILLGER